jgi:hypothetical protein
VGGVYGYGVAMKKHKANELLHQASMLATTISAKALTNDGVLPETITDFGNSGYATTLTDNGTKFILTMKDVDSAVCDQLKKGGMIQGVDCKEGTSEGKMNAEITYYKNLATNPAEGEKSPTGGKTINENGCNMHAKTLCEQRGFTFNLKNCVCFDENQKVNLLEDDCNNSLLGEYAQMYCSDIQDHNSCIYGDIACGGSGLYFDETTCTCYSYSGIAFFDSSNKEMCDALGGNYQLDENTLNYECQDPICDGDFDDMHYMDCMENNGKWNINTCSCE